MAEKKFKIGSVEIGEGCPVRFIADLGASHDGDLSRAIDLIQAANESGVDIVKFQHFQAASIVSKKGFDSMPKSGHQAAWAKSVFETYEEASLNSDWTSRLAAEAHSCGVEFMSTPYDFQSAELLSGFVHAYKLGSGDITWIEFIRHIARYRKPMLIASGASVQEEVDAAIEAIWEESPSIPVVLMQCNTNYTGDPANSNYLNLRVLTTFAERNPRVVLGLSDHTISDTSVLGAVALGAKVVEKHFTDDRDRNGPDHGFSTLPDEWRSMVARVRELESQLGDGIKRIEANEQESVVLQRRGLRARRQLQKGERITRDAISVLRPCGNGALSADELNNVVGALVIKDIGEDDLITWANIKA